MTPISMIVRPSMVALAASGLAVVLAADGGHGGAVVKTRKAQFEVVFRRDGLVVYPPASADLGRLTGTASFAVPGVPKPFVYPLAKGPSSLSTAVDLSRLPTTGVTATFRLAGLPDPAEPNATFTVPFALAKGEAAPAPAPAAISIARSTAADQLAIAAQRACRVSGEPLGSMGPPIKVMRGNQVTFLCCKGCLPKVQADPDRYLGTPAARAR